MRKRIINIVLCSFLALCILLGYYGKSYAAMNDHVHEMGNVPMIERILWEEVLYHYYYVGTDGRTYDYQEVSQYCLWYYSCYCGYRDNYFYQGRIIYRDVLVE